MKAPWFSATRLLFLSLVFALPAGTIYAQERPGIRPFVKPPEDCYVSDLVEPENIYSFLRVQILALSLAQKGERANSKMLSTNGGAPLSEIDQTIAGLREERIENTCASFVVSYYVDSKNPTMATVAKFLAYAYTQFGDMSNEMLGINLQRTNRKAVGPSPQRQLSALLQRRQEILKGMMDALNLSLDLLVDDNRADEKGEPDHLILRNSDIKDLFEYLYARFPALKDRHGTELPGDFAKQAASIQAFLASGYKPADFP